MEIGLNNNNNNTKKRFHFNIHLRKQHSHYWKKNSFGELIHKYILFYNHKTLKLNVPACENAKDYQKYCM